MSCADGALGSVSCEDGMPSFVSLGRGFLGMGTRLEGWIKITK